MRITYLYIIIRQIFIYAKADSPNKSISNSKLIQMHLNAIRPFSLKFIALFCTFSLGSITVLAQSDSLRLSNGDVIVGEIKNMDKGVIQFETDYSDSDFKIEWDQVREVYSPRTHLITISDGTRVNATINTVPNNPQQVIVNTGTGARTIDLISVVYIKPLEKKFISRLSASVGIGYNFTRSNNLSQLTSRISLGYLSDFWSLNGSLDIVNSTQDEVSDISRLDGIITFRYFLKNDWFLLAKSDFLSNTEQKLDLRTALSVGIGKFLIHTNKSRLGLSGGVVLNDETYTDETIPARNSGEAFFAGSLDIFDMGDLSLLTNLTTYPSFTERGRVRLDFKFDLKYDLPLDFYINLGYTHNFDNQPVEGAAQNDYVLQTTFGWDL